MAAAPPPIPQEVLAQANPEQARSVFMAEGVGQPQPGMEAVQGLQAKLKELEKWLTDVLPMVEQVHPPLKAVLAPIAKAGQECSSQLEDFAKRSGMAQGSPVVSPPGAPPNPAAGVAQGRQAA